MSKISQRDVERLQHAASGDAVLFTRKLQPGVVLQLASFVNDQDGVRMAKSANGKKSGSKEWQDFLGFFSQKKVHAICNAALDRLKKLAAEQLAQLEQTKKPSF